jgi:hypothetical protein
MKGYGDDLALLIGGSRNRSTLWRYDILSLNNFGLTLIRNVQFPEGDFSDDWGVFVASCYPQTAGLDENSRLQPVILRSYYATVTPRHPEKTGLAAVASVN